jgi:hypothetical protein
MNEDELILLVAGAVLHDVGILLLAEKEPTVDLRQHTALGYSYLKKAEINKERNR